MGTTFPDSLAPEKREASKAADAPHMQSCGFLLELSPDWLILRASENAHGFLGHYHQRLVGEPLASFTLAQALHDLRNSLSRQRSACGIARAYRLRLIDEPRYFDFAFQHVGDRILLEGLPSADGGFGSALGSVSRLIDGLDGPDRSGLLENAARRMRALTGFDHVTAIVDGRVAAESSRSGAASPLTAGELGDIPPILVDCASEDISTFPGSPGDYPRHALLRAATSHLRDKLRHGGIRSGLRVPILATGEAMGEFVCTNRNASQPGFELHAAAELFAQCVAMRMRA